MAGVVSVGLALYGASESGKAKKEAGRATALSIEQQRQITAEEIRRQEYTFKRDISSIEAEVAASGLTDPQQLRKVYTQTTQYDAEITRLEPLALAEREELINKGDVGGAFGSVLASVAVPVDSLQSKLLELKEKREFEIAIPWEKEG